jgi:hypothetical protein
MHLRDKLEKEICNLVVDRQEEVQDAIRYVYQNLIAYELMRDRISENQLIFQY